MHEDYTFVGKKKLYSLTLVHLNEPPYVLCLTKIQFVATIFNFMTRRLTLVTRKFIVVSQNIKRIN